MNGQQHICDHYFSSCLLLPVGFFMSSSIDKYLICKPVLTTVSRKEKVLTSHTTDVVVLKRCDESER